MKQAIRQARRLGLVTLLTAAALLLLAASASASPQADAEALFVEKMNAARKAGGLSQLVVHDELVRVARDWTPRMVADGKISHRPDLATVVNADWQRLGENVGRSVRPDATTSQLVERLHQAFMDSPGHRANILGDYNHVGVGVVVSSDGAMWVTVNFMLLPTVAPAPAPAPAPPAAKAPIDESVRISQQVFAAQGKDGRQADYAVVGRAEVFADALGGSGLAADRGPILFTNGPNASNPDPGLDGRIRGEIDRVLGGSGTVYLLGGPNALPERVANDLRAAGYTVTRLAGASRVETSVRVAEEIVKVHGAPKRILVARADDWPDAVSGGAYAAAIRGPLVLTGRDQLHPSVAAFLAKHPGTSRSALGGQAALADPVVAQAGAARVAGADRTATAVAVAEQLWGRRAATAGDRYVSTPGWGDDAWAYALALAPWSAANTGPQLLVAGDRVPGSVSSYLGRLGYGDSVKGDVFPASVVPGPVVQDLRQLVGG